MNFYLNNTHRKYMGLKPLKDNYDLVIIKAKDYSEVYLFFDKNIIKKKIKYVISDKYISIQESDVYYETTENRSIILPKTNRGKPRKLNYSSADSLDGANNYFWIYYDKESKKGNARIGNYTTQKSFFEDNDLPDCSTFEKIELWCNKYVEESTLEDLENVEKFSKEKRQHINYQEGDYFRVKYGRNNYSYGRILMNLYKRKKKGFEYWYIVMGRPVIVEMFHIFTDKKDVTIRELENLKTFPSQYILDNNIYYGDYEIIGHKELPEIIKFPIMYGRERLNNKIVFQCGEIHREIEYTKDNLIRKTNRPFIQDFTNSSIGFCINNNPETIKKCIKEKSNDSYWKYYSGWAYGDLRAPENREYLEQVLKQFDLEYLLDIYNE